jgi:hypothetical protein
MSNEYISQLFEVVDGKMNFDKLGKKKRGRKPGYHHTEETKQKIADQMTNRKKTDETKQKISDTLSGRPKSEETKRRISERRKRPDKSVAADFLNQYSGESREHDIPTPTVEWLERLEAESGVKINRQEICGWIRDHFDELNTIDESAAICSESQLNAFSRKKLTIEHDILVEELEEIFV